MFLALPVTKLGRGSKILKNSTHVPHYTPLGYFVIREIENTKIYPYIKFEVSSFTRSKFMEGSQNSKFWPPDSHNPTLGDILSSLS